MRLTKAQIRCLVDVAEGLVKRHFDVYAGYAWTRGDSETAWRKSEHDAPAPIKALLEKGAITVGNFQRPHSGRRILTYIPTEAGRAALRASQGEGGRDV